MKYQCSDGYNRDKYIDEYLTCQKIAQDCQAEIERLIALRDNARKKASELSFNYLGAIGHVAIEKSKLTMLAPDTASAVKAGAAS